MTEDSDAASSHGALIPGGRRRAALAFVFVTVLLDVIAAGIVTPILPKLVLSFLADDVARTAEIVGALGTAFALMQFLFSVTQGAVSDRLGRRPVILASNFGLGIDYIIMAVAPSLGWLLAGRIVSGITAASIMTSHAYVTDVTPAAGRAKAYGTLAMAIGLGSVAGPALGGLLGEIDLRLPFWVAAALSLANGCYGLAVVPESLPRERRTALSWARVNPLGAVGLLRRFPWLRRLTAASFFVQLASVVVATIFVLYVGWRFAWTVRDAGLALAGLGLCTMVVQGWLVGILTKRWSARSMLLIGLACNAVGFAVLGLAPDEALVWASFPLVALGGLVGPAALSMITGRAGDRDQGHLIGAMSSLLGIASLIGPGLFATIFAASVGSLAGWGLPGAGFLVAGLCLAIAFVLV